MAKHSAPTIDDVIEQVAEDVIGILERGEAGAGMHSGVVKNPALLIPRNAITQRPYTGFNVIRGILAMLQMGTMDGRFCTVAKAREYSGEKVFPLKGTSATRMMRPISVNTRKCDDENQAQEAEGRRKLIAHELALGSDDTAGDQKAIVGFKPFPIFHVSQLQVSDLEAFDPPPLDASPEITSHELVRHFVAASGARVEPGPSPCFIAETPTRPGGVISMPLTGDHASPDSWAADMLHEFYHWTGTPDRQARRDDLENGLTRGEASQRFAEGYAIEEVRAEFFAALTGRMLGLDYDIREHASYIDFWGARVGAENENAGSERATVIRSVIQDVAPIVAALQAFMVGEEPDLTWFPDQSNWPEDTRAYFAQLSNPLFENANLEEARPGIDEPLSIPPALAATFADQAEQPAQEPMLGGSNQPGLEVRQPKSNTLNIERHSRPWGRVNTIKGPTPGL